MCELVNNLQENQLRNFNATELSFTPNLSSPAPVLPPYANPDPKERSGEKNARDRQLTNSAGTVINH